MAWYLGSVRIFPQEDNSTWEQLSVELNPLGGGSIIHNFGHSEEKRAMNAYIVGLADKVALSNMTISGIFYTLSGPYGAQDYIVKSVKTSQVGWYCQTIRPDLAEDAPVFIADVELWLDE